MFFGTQSRSSGDRAACSAPARRSGALLCTLLPGLAAAHSEGATLLHAHSWSVQSGWLHPFSGLDHLLAMIALGVLAAQRGGRSAWLLPAVFLACLAAGGVAGVLGLRAPALEAMLVVSLFAFGAAIANPVRLSGAALVAIVAGFAWYHGLAHGLEVPAGSESVPYFSGFLLASATLHAGGIVLATALRRAGASAAIRIAGAGIAATGLVLLLPMAA